MKRNPLGGLGPRKIVCSGCTRCTHAPTRVSGALHALIAAMQCSVRARAGPRAYPNEAMCRVSCISQHPRPHAIGSLHLGNLLHFSATRPSPLLLPKRPKAKSLSVCKLRLLQIFCFPTNVGPPSVSSSRLLSFSVVRALHRVLHPRVTPPRRKPLVSRAGRKLSPSAQTVYERRVRRPKSHALNARSLDAVASSSRHSPG